MSYSDFEQSAQHTAVEAVERRWKQRHDAEMLALRKKRLNNCMAIFVLLSVFGGIGYYALQRYGDEIHNLVGFDIRDIAKLLPVGILGSSEDGERIETYVSLVESFRDKKCVLWRDAPSVVKPQSAQKGVKYLAIVADRGAVRLFDHSASGNGTFSGKELSPVGSPAEVDVAKFNEAVAHKTHFILCNDIVYICGSKDLVQGKRLLKELLPF